MVTSTNPTIATVLGISARLGFGPTTELRVHDETYVRRLRLVLAAAKSWAQEIERLTDLVQQRPDLYPIRTPVAQMPNPDGFDTRRDKLIAWWKIDDQVKLGYHEDYSWAVYRTDHGDESTLWRVRHLEELADMAERARTNG